MTSVSSLVQWNPSVHLLVPHGGVGSPLLQQHSQSSRLVRHGSVVERTVSITVCQVDTRPGPHQTLQYLHVSVVAGEVKSSLTVVVLCINVPVAYNQSEISIVLYQPIRDKYVLFCVNQSEISFE